MKRILSIFVTAALMFCSVSVLVGCGCSHGSWEEDTILPTCTERGIRGSKCTKCGYHTDTAEWSSDWFSGFKIIYIDPLGHDYVPTDRVDDEGNEYVEFECSRCGDTYRMMYTPARDATCQKDGNIEYYKRSTDRKYFTDKFATNEISLLDTVIPKSHRDADGDGYCDKCNAFIGPRSKQE